MAHSNNNNNSNSSNSFSVNQAAHFQQPPSNGLGSQILFPQSLSMQHGTVNGGSLTVSHNSNSNSSHHNNCGSQQMAQFSRPPQQLAIPFQLGAGGHTFTPLDLSYLVQGGCLPHCVPIQLSTAGGSSATPGTLQSTFQAALGCVAAAAAAQSPSDNNNNNNNNNNNSFLQFANVTLSSPCSSALSMYPPQCAPHSHTVTQQQQQHKTVVVSLPPPPPPPPSATCNITTSTTTATVKKRKKPLAVKTTAAAPAAATATSNTAAAASVVNNDLYQSVGVQTDFDMSLCRQQIIVVPPKNCTCGAVAKAVESGTFQAASFPPARRSDNRRSRRVKSSSEDDMSHQNHVSDNQCNNNGVSAAPVMVQEQPQQPSCDNRGRPFTYECLYCPKKFSLHSRLVAHLRCHTGMRPFSCLQCGYSFTQRSYLNRHAAVHKQERPFSCLTCLKTYKHYGSLANHRKLHLSSSSTANTTTTTTSTVVKEDSLELQQQQENSSKEAVDNILSSVSTQPHIMVHTSSSSQQQQQQQQQHIQSYNQQLTNQLSQLTNQQQLVSLTNSHQYSLHNNNNNMYPPAQMFPPPSQHLQQQQHHNNNNHHQQQQQQQQTITAFYQGPGQDGQSFLLSLNPSVCLPSSSMSAILQLQPQYTTSTLTNSSSSAAYLPVMSSPAAFSSIHIYIYFFIEIIDTATFNLARGLHTRCPYFISIFGLLCL